MKFEKLSSIAITLSILLVGGCGIRFELQDQSSHPAAPLVNGENSAPELDTTAEEILLAQLMPSAVLVLTGDNQTLNIVHPDGSGLAAVQMPGMGAGDPRDLHLAGSWKLGEPLPAVVYHAFEPEQAIRQSAAGGVEILRAADGFLGMAGAEGQSAFSFSTISYESGVPVSRLFAGTNETIGNAPAFYETQDSQMGMALKPVAVESVGGQPQGVWYIQTAWGVGGVDLIYPVNRGLYFFDLTTGENLIALDLTRNVQGISPDHTRAASVDFDGSQGMISVHDLETGALTEFIFAPQTDRGAGYAVFSPDNRYVAWLEAAGSLTGDPEFQPRVRVGDLESGRVAAELDKVGAAQALSWETIPWMKPVGFLDGDSLLVEARGEQRGLVAILRFDFSTNSASQFNQGGFSGFAYP